MNSDTLTRQAIRLAQREGKKRGRPLTKEEVMKLHVQTVSPWTRAFFILVGLGGFGISVLCYFSGGGWWITGAFVLAAIATIVIGLFGKKEYLDRELKKVTPAGIADSVLTSIFNGLT